MIKTQNNTPEVYYKQSRDFQYLGRLFDLILNSVKTNSDLIYNLPLNDDSDDSLVDLLAMTLGFNTKHNYNVKQLKAICSAFTLILKNKGNLQAINTMLKVMFNSEGLTDVIEYNVENNQLQIYIPTNLTDMNLLLDIMPYVLPAGITCKFIKTTLLEETASTELTINDSVNVGRIFRDIDTSKIIKVEQNSLETATDSSGSGMEAVIGTIGNTTVIRPANLNPNNSETNIDKKE